MPREARPPPKAAGAEGAPELREGFKQKLEAYIIEAFKNVAYIQPGSAGKRALHVRDYNLREVQHVHGILKLK